MKAIMPIRVMQMSENEMWMKWVALAFMLGIVFALGSGLYFLLFRRKSEQTAKALTWRIALSLTLFCLLWVAFGLGWVRPHGLFSIFTPKQTEKESVVPYRSNN